MVLNFFDTVFQTLLRNKQKPLVVWPEGEGKSKSYTGNELLEKIGITRVALLNQNVKPSQRVLLAMPVSIDMVCALFAIQSVGAVPVLPPARATANNLFKVIKNEQARFAMIANAPSLLIKAVAFAKGLKLVVIHNSPGVKQAIEVVKVSPGQPALISHSSGSTGHAKAIYRSHRVLLAQHFVLKEAFPPWDGQVDFPLFPNILLHNLAVGVVSVLPNIHGFKLRELEPARIVHQLINEKVQTVTGNVFYFKKLLEHLNITPITFPDVRAVGIGGSPVPEALAIALKAFFILSDIYIIYGSSEAEPIAVRKLQQELIDPMAGYKVGKVNKNLVLNISAVGEVQVAGKIYVVGEIEVNGAHVAINEDGKAFQTGDFGYLDKHNELYLTARKGNEKVCHGFQHYQIEHFLANHTGVERVAAIVNGGQFDVFVQGEISEQGILNILKEHLPIQVIKSINKRDNIPVDERHLCKIIYSKVS